MSASSKMISGALPPSSKDNFLRVEEDCFMSSLPTGVLPVKLILRTMGDVHSSSPRAGVFLRDVTKLRTPGGMPALWASSARAFAVRGVSAGLFATTEQPAARAGPIFRVIMACN